METGDIINLVFMTIPSDVL